MERALRTGRLSLHVINSGEARRTHDREPQASDAWAADYPFEGDLAAIGSFLHATERDGEQRPFGYYQIRRQSDGLAVGGVGFKLGRDRDRTRLPIRLRSTPVG